MRHHDCSRTALLHRRRNTNLHVGFVFFAFLVLGFTGGISSADEFHPTITAPVSATIPALKADASSLFHRIKRDDLSMSDIVRQYKLHADLFDLKWRIMDAIDAGETLANFQTVGIMSREDGGYQFDVEQFPYWHPLEERIRAAFHPDVRESTYESLMVRGFRDNDIQKLREYVAQHNPQLRIVDATAPITTSFAAMAKQRFASGKNLVESDRSAYGYQLGKASAEAVRVWAAGLLGSLDNQRQRILESYLTQEHTTKMAIFPTPQSGRVEKLQRHFENDRHIAILEQKRRSAELRWAERTKGQ